MDKSNKKHIFWIDNLGFTSFWSVWRLSGGLKRHTFYYKKISPVVNHLIHFVNKNIELKLLEYDLGKMKTEDGPCLKYKIDKDTAFIMEKILYKMNRKKLLCAYLNRFPQAKTLLYLKQRLYMYINESISLLHIVDYYCRIDKDIAGLTNIIVSKSSNILKSCLTSKEKKTFTFIGYRTITNFYFHKVTLRIVLDVFVQAFCSLFYFVKPKRRSHSLAKIGIACTQKIDLDKRSPLFWVPYSSINPKRIFVYFDDPKKPATTETAKLLDKYGIDWLVLHRRASKTGKKNLWKLAPLNFSRFFTYLKYIWHITVPLFFQPGYLKLWQWYMLIELLIQTYYYETFYRDANITVLYNLNETDWVPTMNAIAVELANGISVSTHWSNHAVQSLAIAKAHDVFFSWSHLYTELLYKCMSCFYHVIQCGYIYDCYFNRAKITANSLRKKFKDSNVSFIIGFMDNIFGKDLFFSKEEMLRVYQELLNLTITDKRIGLILKPKRAKDTIWLLTEIQPLLKKATESGRCFIIDISNLEFFSFEAALACDLVVGFGVSTAAIESALAGIRAVNYDPSGNQDTSEYKEGYNKILFDDINLLIEAIKNSVNTSVPKDGFGDYGHILQKIDPFRDGKSAQRIGFYMNELLRSLDDRLGRNIAIERASHKYQQRYGEDKVDKFERKFRSLVF